MQSLPTVSIVTVSFNQSQFLERTIHSVISQDYPKIEYSIIDGGSTDGSQDIIERYTKRLHYCRIGKDRGPADALNEGFRHATGEIFAYLNSDDVLLPATVSRWVAAFQKTHADIVFGDVAFVDANDAPTTFPGKRVHVFKTAAWRLRAHAAGALVIPQQATAWRREVFSGTGGFNASNSTSWDGEFFVDAALRGFRFQQIKATLAQFRIHNESISGSGRRDTLYAIDRARVETKWQRAGTKVSVFEKILWKMAINAERFFRQPSAIFFRAR